MILGRFGSKYVILGHFWSKNANFDPFEQFQPFSAIFVTFLQNHPVH